MFIVVACAATLYTHGIRNIADAADAAQAMKPLAGHYASILFAAGLVNASLFAASILPLSTAYNVCEGLGFESGLDKSFREAPFFYWLYSLLIVFGAAIVLHAPTSRSSSSSCSRRCSTASSYRLSSSSCSSSSTSTDLMGEYTNSQDGERNRDLNKRDRLRPVHRNDLDNRQGS